jgi:hypothetical protein
MSDARANARAAVITMFKAYREDVEISADVYAGRPRTLRPPHGFIDRITEAAVYPAGTLPQRTLRVEFVVVWGLFDSGDAVAQADRFCDGFMEWVTDDVHAAGSNTTIGIVAMEDEPDFVNDWMPPDAQKVYFASRITLEVYDPG